MHTFEASAVRFHHNGDFSGDVIICEEATGNEFRVPFEDMKKFVAEYVRCEKIARIEQTSLDEDAIQALEDATWPPS